MIPKKLYKKVTGGLSLPKMNIKKLFKVPFIPKKLT